MHRLIKGVVPISSRRPHAAILIDSGLIEYPPVNISMVSYSHDQYQQRSSFNLVQNPKIPHKQAVDLIVAFQLLNACRIYILSQGVDSSSNPFRIDLSSELESRSARGANSMRNANQMPSSFLILSHDGESRPIDDFRKLSPGVYCVDLFHSHDPPLMPKRTFKHKPSMPHKNSGNRGSQGQMSYWLSFIHLLPLEQIFCAIW
jgi:hypothetical protein